jgi:ABC-type Fe3+ transport system permease subunit
MKEIGSAIVLLVVFLIPITAIIVSYFTRKLQSEERLRAIEKGVPLPEIPASLPDRWQRAADLRLAGLILVAVGLGLVALFVGLWWSVEGFPFGVCFAATIPFLIGVAFLYEYRMRRKELGPRPMPPVAHADRV